MSKTTKIVLAVVGTLGLLLVVGAVLAVRLFDSAITLDSDDVQEVAQSVVAHELPPGFEGMFATDIADIKMAISGETISNSEAIIMFMRFPQEDNLTQEELTSQMRNSFQQQTGQQINFDYAGTRDIEINGEAVEIDWFIGTENGFTMRQEIGAFTALDGGVGMVMFVGPETWFEGSTDEAFYESMR